MGDTTTTLIFKQLTVYLCGIKTVFFLNLMEPYHGNFTLLILHKMKTGFLKLRILTFRFFPSNKAKLLKI